MGSQKGLVVMCTIREHVAWSHGSPDFKKRITWKFCLPIPVRLGPLAPWRLYITALMTVMSSWKFEG